MFSRKRFAFAIAGASMLLAATPAAAVQLVANGGFETGNFAGWTQGGNLGFTGVTSSNSPHSGTYHAFLGPVGSPGSLSQSLSTINAGEYVVSFWLKHDGGTPNSFSAFFDDTPLLLNLNDSNAFQYFEFSFTREANNAPSLLRFEFQQDPAFWYLDDVSVNGPVPEPAAWAMMLLGFGIVGRSLRKRRRGNPYALQAA